MQEHNNLSDTGFVKNIADCQLHPSQFTHEAHLRLAWILIRQHGIEKAESIIPLLLQSYVQAIGAKDKYNSTLTHAAIKAVYHFMLKSESDTFSGFISEFARLKYNFRDLMACHYSFDIYQSPQAKAVYLEPDLLPFD